MLLSAIGYLVAFGAIVYVLRPAPAPARKGPGGQR